MFGRGHHNYLHRWWICWSLPCCGILVLRLLILVDSFTTDTVRPITIFRPTTSFDYHSASSSSSLSIISKYLYPLSISSTFSSLSLHVVPKKVAMEHSATVAGRVWPTLKKFHIKSKQWPEIYHNIQAITEWQEIIILPFISFLFFPMIRWLLYRILRQKVKQSQQLSQEDPQELILRNPGWMKSLYQISQQLEKVGRVAFSVYLVDVVSVFLSTIGFRFPKRLQLSNSYAKIAYTIFIVSNIVKYKTVALCKLFNVKETEMGKVDILDRILNGFIVMIATLLIFDWLSIQLGKAMSGILAFGSIGTIAFTLASQNILKELLSGFFLLFSNKMYVGDNVMFGDGTSGRVLDIGWLETRFRGSDNMETIVPNALISSQKISNVSRIRISQVKQIIRIRYQDASKIQSITDDIKNEIIASCPKLIKDPKVRPFRIYGTDYKSDHLEVMIDTHHTIPPNTDEYFKNREQVLFAILRGVQKNNVQLQHYDSRDIYGRYQST